MNGARLTYQARCGSCGSAATLKLTEVEELSDEPWTPFTLADTEMLSAEEIMALHPLSTREQAELVIAEMKTGQTFTNSIYQVLVIRRPSLVNGPDMIWLSIKRRDKKAIHDWRHFQRIKNELTGEENEGVELYPAESRLADCANQYHMWVIVDPKFRFPFGFNDRHVEENGHDGKWKQRGVKS